MREQCLSRIWRRFITLTSYLIRCMLDSHHTWPKNWSRKKVRTQDIEFCQLNQTSPPGLKEAGIWKKHRCEYIKSLSINSHPLKLYYDALGEESMSLSLIRGPFSAHFMHTVSRYSIMRRRRLWVLKKLQPTRWLICGFLTGPPFSGWFAMASSFFCTSGKFAY